MSRPKRLPIPLRIRLTLWYTFSLALILLLFSAFVYYQVRSRLVDQVDTGLYLAANQALIGVDESDNKLAFQVADQDQNGMRHLNDDFIILLLAPDGTIWDTLSNEDRKPPFATQTAGFQTQVDEGEPWRVYRQAVNNDPQAGWIQVAQELDPLNSTLANLQTQMFWGLPLALLLAGIGGYFLASRALRPIHTITQTAQAITANDLGQRLHYQGPRDEVGRLAETFDTMLDRLQGAFVHERRFTGDAAHELRTPLAALKGQIGVTLSKSRSPAAYQETLHTMEGQVDRLIRLSSDLLFMTRLDQEQFQLQIEHIALTDFIGAVVDQIRPFAEPKMIQVSEEIPPKIIVEGDMELLIRLFLNLLDNAVKYTPQNGRITIKALSLEKAVQIKISDTGPGIAPEHIPHIFERFYRIDDHRTRGSNDNSPGGAGLGLAIAHEIARFHGGNLTMESTLGEGATFIVTLPSIK